MRGRRGLLLYALLFFCAPAFAAEPTMLPPPPALPAAAPPAACACDERDQRTPARVISVQDGWVTIEADRPLSLSDRFILRRQNLVSGIDPATAAPGRVPSGEPSGMLLIERVAGRRGSGRLLRHAYAEPGDLAVPTQANFRESLFYGPRHPRMWRTLVDLRLGPAFDAVISLAMFATGAVEYSFTAPLKLSLEAGPLVFGTSQQDQLFLNSGGRQTVQTGALVRGGATATLFWSLSGFELGAGVGGYGDSLSGDRGLELRFATRAGSLDGFHVQARATALVPLTGAQVRFEAAWVDMNIPLHRRVSLQVSAGGGDPFWVYVLHSLRIYASGMGAPGTTIYTLGIGGGGLAYKNTCSTADTGALSCSSFSVTPGALLFQVGAEHRF